MKPPISFVYGNLIFGASLDDVWAAFSVPTSSYEWLSEEVKRTRLLALIAALEAIEADVQIVRVGRAWDLGGYLRDIERMVTARTVAPCAATPPSTASGSGTSGSPSRHCSS